MLFQSTLVKKRRGDTASKPSSDEVIVRPPPPAKESAPVVHVPAMSVEVIEPVEIPLSSRLIEKPPTLALDPSLALRRAKSTMTKEDMDEYGKLNTNVVKRALAHSLMKVFCFSFLCFIFLLVTITHMGFVVCRV